MVNELYGGPTVHFMHPELESRFPREGGELANHGDFESWVGISFSEDESVHLSWQVTAARNMPHFLRYLTAQVHKLVPGGQVVWYDSVLQSGELKWQNELNENNRWVM